ncbi:MAG: Ig-like domain-containing protein, partial [bacterium]|nr:Ig-like domain-containing protein [bacterium]
MRNRSCLTILSLLVLVLFSMPVQAGMYLDHVVGATAADTLPTGSVITFHVGMLVDIAGNITGYTNGFHVYSSTGADWSTSTGAYTGAITSAMVEQSFVNPFSITGTGADTIGFGGFRLFAPGIPVGFNEVVSTIEIGPITAGSHCGEICLDSAYYPPAGIWKWSTTAGDVFPTWDGPHCYTVFDPAQGPCGGGNTPPVLAVIGDKSVDEGQLLSFGMSATDDDGDPLTFTPSALPAGAVFVDNGDGTASFDWIPTFDQAGSYAMTVDVSDGTDLASETITITVNNVNRPPVLADPGPQSGDEGAQIAFTMTGSDPDGDPLGFSILTTDLPAGYSFTDNGDGTADFDWTPGFDDAGGYTATVELSDGEDTDEGLVFITVLEVNRSPVLAAIGDKNVTAGELLSFTTSATDPDGDAVSMGMDVIPPGASYVDNGDGTGDFNWTPDLGNVGPWTMYFIATDGDLSDSEFVTITVLAPNTPPSIAPISDYEITECDTLFVPVSASDPDGDPLMLWMAPLASNMNFTDNADGTGELDFTPSFAQAGTYNLDAFVTDGEDTAMTSFVIVVLECSTEVFDADLLMDPDTIFVLWADAINPISGFLYFGNFSDAHTPGDVNGGSLMINGSIPAIA